MKWEKLEKKDITLFIKLTVASFLYVLPIILADRYYNDDLARALRGATGWEGDGRPLGEYLILLLCGGKPIVDLSPLFLILSVLILSFALTLYAKENFKRFDCGNIEAMVLLFIITNPFAMSNLSYKYDCIIMFTALSLAFLAYTLPITGSKAKMCICSVLLGVMIMSLYQPAIGMCIILFVVAVFFCIMEDARYLAWEVIRFICIAVGVVIYKIVVAPHFVSVDDWRYKASKTVLGLGLDAVKAVVNNIVGAFKYIGVYVSGISRLNQLVLALLIILSLITITVNYLSLSTHKTWRRLLDVVFILVSPIMVFVASFSPLVILASVDMRSRIFLTFGGFLFFIGVLLMYFGKKHKVSVMLLLLLALSFQYIYMYAYGNALKSQKEYEKYIVYNVAHDLETLNVSDNINFVSFDGDMPRCRQVRMICDKYPFFREIVPVYINNDTWIGGAWVYHYLQEDIKIGYPADEDLAMIDSIEPVKDNSQYSCYIIGNRAIVRFH